MCVVLLHFHNSADSGITCCQPQLIQHVCRGNLPDVLVMSAERLLAHAKPLQRILIQMSLLMTPVGSPMLWDCWATLPRGCQHSERPLLEKG